MSNASFRGEGRVKDSVSNQFSKSIFKNCDNVNKFTNKIYSRRWHDIHKKRVQLPVWKYKETFLKLLDENQAIVLVGETGSGKTTQIPQWCLEYCWQKSSKEERKHLRIACTQPRRIAAMSVAARVAEEMDCSMGEQVGYSVRFDNNSSPKTVLLYMTDGMLLREATLSENFSNYDIIILDEAHERTLQTEILLGVVKRSLLSRNSAIAGGDSKTTPLKVVIMSATINVKIFRRYFEAPILRVEGRQYTVHDLVSEVPQSDLLTSTLTCVFQVHRNCEDGDILVFCAGQDEIQSLVILTKRILKYAATQPHVDDSLLNLIPLPLYASLPGAQQMQVFNREMQIGAKTNGILTNGKSRPKNGDCDDENSDSDESTRQMINSSAAKHKIFRRVIYATNVAETSVTIPNIRYVIDTGKVKCRNYCPKTGLESLKITNISKAQAKQRSGRAGRLGPGTCYRLYTIEDYELMAEHPVPEIKRCSLDGIILQLIAISPDNIHKFPYLERPDDERIKSALRNLLALKAIAPSKGGKKLCNGHDVKALTNGTNSAEVPIASTSSSALQSESHKNQTAGNQNNRIVTPATLADDNELLNLSYDLTSLGLKIRMFPLHPSMARIIIAANDLGCLDEALTVVSLLAIESLFHIPPNKQAQADIMLSKFHSNEGDTIMLLNVFRAFRRTSVINRQGLKQWCMEHFIHIKNLKLARLIRKQLLSLTKSYFGMQSSTCSQDTSILRRALTYGLFNNVATMWDGKYRNRTSTKEIFIHPSSCLFKTRPECILYVEVVDTNKCYMRHCTLIDLSWVREVSATVQI